MGFITASGGPWSTQTLRMLDVGDRVWVTIPKTGFIGVGFVEGEAQPVTEFAGTMGAQNVTITEAITEGNYPADGVGDNCARFAPINGTHTVANKGAVRKVGFFRNQNSVAKPKSEN